MKEKSIVVRIRKQEQNLKSTFLFEWCETNRFWIRISWIRGDMSSDSRLRWIGKENSLSLAFPVDPSVNAELENKRALHWFAVCLRWIKKASSEEQEKAIQEVFKILLMFRSANQNRRKNSRERLEKR